MESTELISIIVPVYNVKHYLKTCVESVLQQTYNQWELLLVDDASTDGSGETCDEWAEYDYRIRVIHIPHSGPAKARNAGMAESKGMYTFFMDSDDWMESEALAYMYNAMHNHHADIVVCSAFFDYPTRTKVLCPSKTDHVLSREDALKRIIIGKIPSYLWLLFLRKSVVREPFVDIPCFEDYATVYKWFSHAQRVAMMSLPQYHYVQRQGSILHSERKDKYLLDIHRERHTYIQENNLMDDASNRANTVRNLLKLAKDFARKQLSWEERKDYLEQIKAILPDYLPVYFSQLGIKRWLRLKILMFSIKLFIRIV